MNSFDSRARDWDKEKWHTNRAIAIASELGKMIPLNPAMKALEYGAGTGILSFLLKDQFAEITLMDSSGEMIEVCKEKAAFYGTPHIKPLWIDLEHTDYEQKFDVIYNQMVLHHITDVDTLLRKFYSLLHPGGYLAIADLFAEDGSFHSPEVKVHHGFDPVILGRTLETMGFKDPVYHTCYTVRRESEEPIRSFYWPHKNKPF